MNESENHSQNRFVQTHQFNQVTLIYLGTPVWLLSGTIYVCWAKIDKITGNIVS